MAKRKRDVQLKFRVTPQEREMIETKMAQFGKSPALLQSARCHGILILEKHNVFEKEAVKCLF